MGYTIAEKIMGRASRAGAPVPAGAEVEVKPDYVLGYDFPGYLDLIFKQMKEEFGIERVAEPERYALFIDHMVPANTPEEEELHIVTRTWCAENGVRLHEREGIGHQVAAEAGYAVPGGFVVHFDGHIAQLGAFGTLAIGIHTQLLEAFVRERIDFTVPETTRVNLTGRLAPGVMARDVFHHLVRVLGPRSCRFQVLELGGPALGDISLEGRQTITGLAMFTGALTAICNPDRLALDYARAHVSGPFEPQASDEDAHLRRAARGRPHRSRPRRGGAAQPGRHRRPRRPCGARGPGRLSRLLCLRPARGPARRRGGAQGPPRRAGLPAPRRAHQPGDHGGRRPRGPADHADRGRRLRHLVVVRLLLRAHRDHDRGPARGLDRHAQRHRAHGEPGLRDLPLQCRGGSGVGAGGADRRPPPVPGRVRAMSLAPLRGRVAFVFEEADFDVDQIVGVENIRLTDPDALAACAMRRFDPGFAEKVEPGDVVVGAENFGYGHPHFAPMIGLRRLGVRAVIADSFATGYWREEIAEGFPQIACPGITSLAQRWDEIEIDWEAAEVRNLSRGGALPTAPYSTAERGMLQAGGLIPYLREKLTADGGA